MRRSIWTVAVIGLFAAAIVAGCATSKTDTPISTGTVTQENGKTVREFAITAKAAKHELKPGTKIDAWTFNGSVPGTELRVTQGDLVRVNLNNELPDPVTIHWHGVRVPNVMDGVSGVTQNAIQPKQSFTYEFEAKDSGTYWYHSHQDSSNQVDKGLYGSIIVEPKQQAVKYDREYTLMLDEWMTGMGGMSGMNHGGHGGSASNSPMTGGDMMSMYNIFTINGKSGDAISPLDVKQGERVKLRLVNAGYQTQLMHLHGHSFKVTETDGQAFSDPKVLKDTVVPVAPGERYDLEFTADNPGVWYLENHSENKAAGDMKVAIKYAEAPKGATDKTPAREQLPLFFLTEYGAKTQGEFGPDTKYDVTYSMNLTGKKDSANGEVYLINDKSFPNTEPVIVKQGDKVKVKFVNNSDVAHPMHLHGHFFQVLTRNGKPVAGTAIRKDTLNVLPGEEYEVAFLADNPGEWMFHCHELHHASSGMVTHLMYAGFQKTFTPDPKANNKAD